ncbi:hypothetical protein ACWGE0_22795 [Lentzea sp. NPDC054927]
MTSLRDLTPLRDVVAESGPEASGKEFVAVALQALRRASMLTPTEFAERADLSLADVGLAERGTVPWNVLNQYLAAADATEADRRFIHELWEQSQRRHTAPQAGAQVDRAEDISAARTVPILVAARPASASPTGAPTRRQVTPSCPDTTEWPDPATIQTAPEFQLGFEKLKNSTGASYARLAKVAEGLGYPLPRTTLHNLCTRPRLPMSPEMVSTFVAACGGDEQTVRAWVAAWRRLRTTTGEPGMAPSTQVVSAGEHAHDSEAGEGHGAADDETADHQRSGVTDNREWFAPDLFSRAAMAAPTMSTRLAPSSRSYMAPATCTAVVWSARTVTLRAAVPIAALLFFLGLLSGLLTGVTLTH